VALRPGFVSSARVPSKVLLQALLSSLPYFLRARQCWVQLRAAVKKASEDGPASPLGGTSTSNALHSYSCQGHGLGGREAFPPGSSGDSLLLANGGPAGSGSARQRAGSLHIPRAIGLGLKQHGSPQPLRDTLTPPAKGRRCVSTDYSHHNHQAPPPPPGSTCCSEGGGEGCGGGFIPPPLISIAGTGGRNGDGDSNNLGLGLGLGRPNTVDSADSAAGVGFPFWSPPGSKSSDCSTKNTKGHPPPRPFWGPVTLGVIGAACACPCSGSRSQPPQTGGRGGNNHHPPGAAAAASAPEWLPHALNLLKYCSAFPCIWLPAVVAIFGLRMDGWLGWVKVGALLVNSLYCLAWDIRMDWGVGKNHHHQALHHLQGLHLPQQAGGRLRKLSVMGSEVPYYWAIGVDACLRLAWVLKFVVRCSPTPDHSFLLGPVVSCYPLDSTFVLEAVEVLRRAIWNVFRIEWEYITKCPKDVTKAEELVGKSPVHQL